MNSLSSVSEDLKGYLSKSELNLIKEFSTEEILVLLEKMKELQLKKDTDSSEESIWSLKDILKFIRS